MEWYDGLTVTDKLSDIKSSREHNEDPFMLTVTHFYKTSGVHTHWSDWMDVNYSCDSSYDL